MFSVSLTDSAASSQRLSPVPARPHIDLVRPSDDCGLSLPNLGSPSSCNPQDGSIAVVNERKDLAFQQVGDDDAKHGETLICSTPYLPEDIWHHIHTLMPIRDAARAACLSHTFLRSWRCYPNLTLNLYSLRVKASEARNLITTIDTIVRNHSGIGLKIFKLNLYPYGYIHPYVNSWLQLAVKPGIEELTLLYEKYNFPCSLLSDGVRNSIRYLELGSCAFHPTVKLGLLRSLTNLCLYCVRITGDELECLLSNSLALEELDLYGCNEIIFLKIPCGLQRFIFLSVMSCCGMEIIECKAPNLSRLELHSRKTKLILGEASQLKDFALSDTNGVYYARAELPFIMPNLERLALSSDDEVNTPMLPTKFLYLKHLTIAVTSGVAFSPSYDYFSLVSFLDASPSLEALFLDVSQNCMEHESVFESSSPLRQLPECRHDCLKSVEIIGFSSAKGLFELTCCIVKSAASLERLVLDPLGETIRCYGKTDETCWPPMSKTVLEEAFRTVEAIRTYIEDEVPTTASMTVVEPCARCYSRG